MNYEKFERALNIVRSIDDYFFRLDREFGIDIRVESSLNENINELQKILFVNEYGEEGWDWITSYLYERSDGDGEWAWDENKNPIRKDDKGLWEYLEKYHHK